MAASVSATVLKPEVPGSRFVGVFDLNPGTISAGGVALAASLFGLTQLTLIKAVSCSGGLVLHWDRGNGKLMFYEGDYSESTDGPLIEKTGDLSSFVATVEVYGL